MRTTTTSLFSYLALAVLAVSCGSLEPTASVRDDVYFMPSDAPPAVATASTDAGSEGTGDGTGQPKSQPEGYDYYDPATAETYSQRNYYDMAYNDPYYYNYGRFGFGGSMGYMSGWNGPGWGMGMGYGYPMGSGWSMSVGYGYGSGFYDPWYGGGWGNPYWNRPYGYSPWGWNDPYMGGYGWGNYYGPYGNCYGCYVPVVIGGSSGVVVGHRPSVTSGSSGSGSGTVAQQRSFRDPVGLTPASRKTTGNDQRQMHQYPSRSGDRPVYYPEQRPQRPIQESRPSRTNRGTDRNSTIERGGGLDRGGSTPSRSGGGGGSRTINSPRPR